VNWHSAFDLMLLVSTAVRSGRRVQFRRTRNAALGRRWRSEQCNCSSSSFVERVLGAIRLDAATYEEVEHDTDATWQAALVVAVAAISSGVGSSGGRTGDLVGGVVAGVIFWAIFALFAYLVGAYLLRGPQTSATFGELL
jgi:hypothetical protein